jgi:hypothetical protein
MIEQAAREMAGRIERRTVSGEYTARAIEAFTAQDFAEAERILLEQLTIDPDNFVVHYNLACARAVQGELETASAALRRAVELGFANLGHLQRDPYLRPLHNTEAFQQLVDNWGLVLDMQRRSRLELARGWVRSRSVERSVDELRLDVVSAHDPIETDRAVAEIERVAGWAQGLFGDEPATGPWVVVSLPGPQDFLKWAFWTYGAYARGAFTGIGGAYEHDDKRLVAQDLGATLRHEFFHVLHWRDMDSRGQVHPVWIQEGLASLVEDMDPVWVSRRVPVTEGAASSNGGRVDAQLVPKNDRKALDEPDGEAAPSAADVPLSGPVPSWRTNIVKRLARAGKLKSFDELTGLSHHRFSTTRPLATYAQARTVLLYLHGLGRLEAWYELYTTDAVHGYQTDPSGLAAMEAVLGEEIDVIERRYLDWVRHDLPMVAEDGTDLDAGLGVDLEPGDDGGPKITKLPRGSRTRTGLRLGDVVTAIDGRPVRDMKEYVRVMSSYAAGERVVVSYRRVRLHGESEAVLVARE